VRQASNHSFRQRVFAANFCHQKAALFGHWGVDYRCFSTLPNRIQTSSHSLPAA
jgi:hypothetical protein